MEIIQIYRRSISKTSLTDSIDQKDQTHPCTKDFIVVYFTSNDRDHQVPYEKHCVGGHQYFGELEDFVIFEQTVITTTTYEISKY